MRKAQEDMSDSRESNEANQTNREGQRESGWDDWWTSDRLDAVGWAAIFIWGAVVVLASYTDFAEDYSWWDGWGVFFVGAGGHRACGSRNPAVHPAVPIEACMDIRVGCGLPVHRPGHAVQYSLARVGVGRGRHRDPGGRLSQHDLTPEHR